MKKLLVLILGLISYCANAQSLNEELRKLQIENQTVYESSEFALINKKIPFNPRDVTLQQLSDTTKPNKQEKNELEKLSNFRKQRLEKDDQVFIKYVSPPEYLSQLMEIRKYTANVSITLLADLYSGKLTFGEYNRKRKEMTEEFATKNRELANRFKAQQAAKKEQSRGRVIASGSEKGITATLYDGECNFSNLSAAYPYRFDLRDSSTNQNLTGCYSINQGSKQVMLANPNGNVTPVSFATFGLGGETQKSTLEAWGDFFNSIAKGAGDAQKYAQPPRPITYIPPGVTRPNYLECEPDGRGGYYCR